MFGEEGGWSMPNRPAVVAEQMKAMMREKVTRNLPPVLPDTAQ
jgi:hypothetical protein